jgi:hypothetical protein
LQHRKTVNFKYVDKTFSAVEIYGKKKNGFAGKAGQDRMGKKGRHDGQG